MQGILGGFIESPRDFLGVLIFVRLDFHCSLVPSLSSPRRDGGMREWPIVSVT